MEKRWVTCRFQTMTPASNADTRFGIRWQINTLFTWALVTNR
jgi:hypothetical protein